MLRWLTAATLCLLLPLLAAPSLAQDATIQGTVTDTETGDALPGASVLIEETQVGTATDVDGQFEIDGIEPGSYTVVVSFVGYREHSQNIDLSAGEVLTLNVELSPDQYGLDELVVTGYAVTPRREVTGAITSLDGADFEVRAIQTPQQALQGRSAGVQMVHSSGEPGSGAYVRIRGVGSIGAGNSPLFIVDGVPLTNDSYTGGSLGSFNPLEGLNPSDIESIEVLRDAEATAIYGAQGANGVILITTRRGMAADTEFRVRTQYGRSQQTGFFDLMDTPTWLEFMGEAFDNWYQDFGYAPGEGRQVAYNEFGDPADNPETYDWQRILHQQGYQYRADVTASGGTESTRFYLSGNFRDQQGTVIGSGFQRYGARVNLDHEATDRLSFEVNVGLTETHREGTATGGNYINAPFHGGLSVRPNTPPYDEDDPTGYNQDIPGVLYNNLQLAHEEIRQGRTTSGIGNVAAMYQLNRNFTLRATAGGEYRNNRDHQVRPGSIPRYRNAYNGGLVYESTREVWNWNTNLILNYNQTFTDVHNVRGLAGYEYRRMYRDRYFINGEGLPGEWFTTLNLASSAGSWGGSQSEFKTQGIFTRLQYNYDQRYFVSANVRYDGHSRFGSNRRYGLFWSGALAWDIAAESFMEEVHWLDQLKPRVSYGITGNSSIGNFDHMTLYGAGGSYGGNAGLRPTNLGNAQLTWEQAHVTDIAVDFSLLGARVYGSAGVYRNDSKRLLLDRFLPLDSGFSGITDNVGVVRNEGIEIEFGVVPLDIGQFLWRSDFNITFQDSEILDLGTNPDGSIRQTVNSGIRLGEKRQVWWGRRYAGVNPADGRPMFWNKVTDEEGNVVDWELSYTASSSDYTVVGSYIPDFYGGWNNTFSYGPVQVQAFFQYEYGSDVQNVTYHAFLMDPSRQRALSTEMLDRWQEPGDITHIPMAYGNNAIRGGTPHSFWSDFRLDDGSYIRLKNLTVSYQLPEAVTRVASLRGASIFVQGENLLTWTEYRGPDPEIISTQTGSYPQARHYTIGLEVGF